MVYYVEDRIEIIKLYFRYNDSARDTAVSFNERHWRKYIYCLCCVTSYQVWRYWFSLEQKDSGMKETTQGKYLFLVVIDQTLCTSKVYLVFHATIMKILKQHPFKIWCVQEQNEDEWDQPSSVKWSLKWLKLIKPICLTCVHRVFKIFWIRFHKSVHFTLTALYAGTNVGNGQMKLQGYVVKCILSIPKNELFKRSYSTSWCTSLSSTSASAHKWQCSSRLVSKAPQITSSLKLTLLSSLNDLMIFIGFLIKTIIFTLNIE